MLFLLIILAGSLQMSNSPNIFDWLDRIREIPSAYAKTASDLFDIIGGYYIALSLHNIQEDVPEMMGHFGNWMYKTTKWTGFNCGWGYAFDLNTPENEDAIKHFYKYVDKYRQLKPSVTAKVTLSPEHQPLTDNKWNVGFKEFRVRPDEIFLVNYHPSSFSFFRYRFEDYYVNGPLYQIGGKSRQRKQSDLFQGPLKQFNIDPAEWEIIS